MKLPRWCTRLNRTEHTQSYESNSGKQGKKKGLFDRHWPRVGSRTSTFRTGTVFRACQNATLKSGWCVFRQAACFLLRIGCGFSAATCCAFLVLSFCCWTMAMATKSGPCCSGPDGGRGTNPPWNGSLDSGRPKPDGAEYIDLKIWWGFGWGFYLLVKANRSLIEGGVYGPEGVRVGFAGTQLDRAVGPHSNDWYRETMERERERDVGLFN